MASAFAPILIYAMDLFPSWIGLIGGLFYVYNIAAPWVFQLGMGFDAVHLAGSDQAGEARPRMAALIVADKKRVATVHGRAADDVAPAD